MHLISYANLTEVEKYDMIFTVGRSKLLFGVQMMNRPSILQRWAVY